MKDQVEKAHAVVTGLRTKLGEVEDRAVALGKERSQVAFLAHTDGGRERKRLDAINAEIATIGSEAESVRSAIGEAERRVAEATAAANADAEKERARRSPRAGQDHARPGCGP